MIIFRPEHVLLILGGNKTQTRRLGKKRWNVGAVHACYTRPPFAKGGAEPFCHVRILAVRRERLFDITEQDARDEGYPDCASFLSAFGRINHMIGTYVSVWVVSFEVTS